MLWRQELIKMKNKNAVELSLNVIVVAAIVLVVLVVSIMIYVEFIGKERQNMDGHIFSIGHDCDLDGLNDAIDRYPCDPEDPDEPKKKGGMSAAECIKFMKDGNCPADK